MEFFAKGRRRHVEKEQFEKIQGVVREYSSYVNCDLPQPTVRGAWATWEQNQSKKVTHKIVKALIDAGIPAFFSPGERRWGVKVMTPASPGTRDGMPLGT
jgi:hypothetical protein